jgi:hypothetical protein
MMELRPFQPARILATLLEHGVAFVVVGGLAAQAHGSPSLTGDVDVCFDRATDNLERLVAALADLDATRRDVEAAGPWLPPLDTRTLRAGTTFTLTTRFGDLDLLGAPDPGLDYASLVARAVTTSVEGRPLAIASLDDLIAMKRAAGRPKDRIELEILGAVREELDRQDR